MAFDAAVTSSRMGVPRYWLQSERLQLTDREQMALDPVTGLATIDRVPFVESNNNFVYCRGRANLLLAEVRDQIGAARLLPERHQTQERRQLWDTSAAGLRPVSVVWDRKRAAMESIGNCRPIT